MAGRQMKVRRAIEVAVQIADAVSDAHAAGFVHGGLSPDSIVITAKGHAKIPAFELASRAGFEPNTVEARLHDYDAPEEAKGEEADERSDVYSVGAILYEMLTTRRPLHRGSAAPSATNGHVPAELDHVVLKAVAPNPASRFQSAAVLAAELRATVAILNSRDVAGDEDERSVAPAAGFPWTLTLVVISAGAWCAGLVVRGTVRMWPSYAEKAGRAIKVKSSRTGRQSDPGSYRRTKRARACTARTESFRRRSEILRYWRTERFRRGKRGSPA